MQEGKAQLTWCWKWRSGFFSLSWSSILASRSLCSFVSLLSVYSFCQLLVPLSFLASSFGFGSWCWRRGSRWWCWSSLRFFKLLPLVLFAFFFSGFSSAHCVCVLKMKAKLGYVGFLFSSPVSVSVSFASPVVPSVLCFFFFSLRSCLFFLVPCSGSPLLSVFPRFLSVSPRLLRSLFSAVRGSFFVSLPLSFPRFFQSLRLAFSCPQVFFFFVAFRSLAFIAREQCRFIHWLQV